MGPGTYSGDSTHNCTACPLNASCASGSTAITDCACNPGHWNQDAHPTTACAPCAPGSVTDTLEEPGGTACTPCTPGHYSPNATTGCSACKASVFTLCHLPLYTCLCVPLRAPALPQARWAVHSVHARESTVVDLSAVVPNRCVPDLHRAGPVSIRRLPVGADE